MIELRHLRKEYKVATPLQDVNITINDGDIISVIGPSGTGKSTLIRCINLLERPTSGQILINGQDITAPGVPIHEVRKRTGMVFQNFNLFSHLTVIENVMLAPMDLLKKSRQEAYDNGMELLRTVGMEEWALSYPDTLSGGQKQRAAIARTLAMNPEIILFDEPTSALDPTMIGEVQSVIRELAHTGTTMMIVTHEMKFAREISNRVFYMDQGGIYEEGTPSQIFDAPEKDLTRRFIRQLKVFEAEICGRNFDFHGIVGELERYGYRNLLSAKMMYRLQAVFEELCHEILLPHFIEPRIRFTVEYDEKAETAAVIAAYDGDSFNPEASENELSFSLLKSLAENTEYSFDDTADMKNRFVLTIAG